MPQEAPLTFQKLPPGDLELVLSLAGAENPEDAASESFGLGRITSLSTDSCRGLYLVGALSGAAWLEVSAAQATAHVPALLLARGWRRHGLAAWMLGELAGEAARLGCQQIEIELEGGGEALARLLDEAGFKGPNSTETDFPRGLWRRACQ
ncbi:MAG: hypothetical protein LBU79_04225 [Planctomycetota bacterium]|jgi:GNAT superfamily N-acetyltransferase|nr:hypothetical protein [Planctomycetota bacterium]